MADGLITISTPDSTAATKSIKMQVLRGVSISLKLLITCEVTSATGRCPRKHNVISEPGVKVVIRPYR